ncbi:hypothetical protein DB42_CR00260 [Neochlamydia sp. EPS4]|uniref:hypothetical protein n=1 Tax=Neochlamydia sp. EPS4 TaxID=1478175 RepID=UPI000583F973|nr:hypothetical protein [Neochlamydia sp. EPS4]KIC72868.1 hypothetical protein DB42_CR00260 [Neochlamydia sp. EPS4]
MQENECFPEIKILVEDQDNDISIHLFKEAIHSTLKKMVPLNFFKNKSYESEFPILKTLVSNQAPGYLTFYYFGKSQKHTLKFFIEMLSNWLVPGRRLNQSMIFSSEFCIPSLSPLIYRLFKVVIHLDLISDVEQIKANLPIIEAEIRLGMDSSYYAKRILEIKGLSIDAKTALIQENIAYLIERKPQFFDFDLLTEMQHVLVICHDDFKSQRSSRHLSRIICIQYLFRRYLFDRLQVQNKRHFFLKIFKTYLRDQEQNKEVLGIIVGFNFLREKEIFDKRHLIRAIQNHIPNALMVENSFIDNRRSPENFCTLYIEIEKSMGEKFTSQEVSQLRKTLPVDLLDSIEHIVHPIFMPRNEEEIMRNIFSLSSQVKFVRDLPQVIINFDEQTYSKLVFTIIVVRVVEPSGASIKELFDKSETFLDYTHDRCKTLGYLRGKHSKEATVFTVKISKDDFIRRDNSIDLNKARQSVVFELLRILGEFRDFNGGMISKQNELLAELKVLLGEETDFNELLLENFFFSITPIVMRTVLEAETLKMFFSLLRETIEEEMVPPLSYHVKTLVKTPYIYVIVKSEERLNREDLAQALDVLQAKSSEIATAYMQVHEVNYNCYLYRCLDGKRQKLFGSIIQKAVINMFDNKVS